MLTDVAGGTWEESSAVGLDTTERTHFSVETIGEITLIRLVDPMLLNQLLVAELQSELIDFIEEARPAKVIVGFATVTHSFTAVVNSMLVAQKRLFRWAGRMVLCGMGDAVRDAYRMLNLDGTVFEICDDVADAVARLNAT